MRRSRHVSARVHPGGATSAVRRAGGSGLALALVGAVLAATLGVGPVGAASVGSAAFTAGGTVVNGTRYAKAGQTLTLTVGTDASRCVEVSGAHTARQSSSSDRTSWTFTFPAGTDGGVKTVTAAAYSRVNAQNGNCIANQGEKLGTHQASYVLDNTGPSLLPSDALKTGVLPAPNAAGWNRSDVAITWTAADGEGSGVDGSPTPATASVTSETPAAGVTRTASAADVLGNVGSGSVTVKLDETVPAIATTRSPAANASGWNDGPVTVAFTCTDALSGVKSCEGGQTLTGNGADQQVVGSAVDNADNTATSTASVSIDTAAPTLTGTPSTAPNAAGWYASDVSVAWVCADQPGLSGIDGSCPSATTIAGEGTGLAASASVSDRAGNTAHATSGPAVNVDTTRPVTSADAPATWNNVDVTVQLSPYDALSGVAVTRYRLDGGPVLAGTSVPVSAEGAHELEYWSVDNAGNEELHKRVDINIDKTPPSIGHVVSPAPNANGWNNSGVTVTFSCSDGAGSGIASCGPDRSVLTEGADQAVTGTAVDHAGNSSTDPAKVSIDTGKPTIAASRDRLANAAGWYRDDVTVRFTCDDALSGVDTCATAVTLGEGGGQSASGTATDAAGNTAGVTEGGINVDKTAPTLSGAATTAANADGWYRGDVTVRWTAGDALSGVATPPADMVLTGEGDEVCAVASVSDRAGNDTTRSVCVRIDRRPPATSASVPAPLPSGWYAGAVPVTLTGVDELSTVDRTDYRIDGGAPVLYTGPFDVAAKGIHTIRFWSVDKAGNVEDENAGGHTVTVKIDGVAPTITGSRLPAANAHGWNNTDVSVSFDCSDAESGIAGCAGATVVSNEGAGQSVTGTAVDNAGNDATAVVADVNVDKTAPSLAGSATTDPNGAGWYRGDVTVRWTGQDALSGIDPATQPADNVVTGEGRNLGAGPVTVADRAGNPTSASVSGIKVDRKGVTITPVKPAPNADGWYAGNVVVGFTCADPALADGNAGSGVASCPSDEVVSGNGADQAFTGGAASDIAGNTSPGVVVSGINIDGEAPQSTADNICESRNGWCRGTTATVRVTAADQAGLSGVKEILTSVNGGPFGRTAGASADVVVPLNKTGLANVRYYAVDRAGNAETANGIALRWDNIAPTVTHTVNPAPNPAGWNTAPATVHFEATDDDTGSGVEPGSVTPDQVVAAETAGTVVDGQATDLAGNVGTDRVTVKLDTTAPAISAAVTAGTLGSNGWYRGPVTVSFTCSDGLSRIATCPDPVTLTANGAGQSVGGTAEDNAGNTASAGVSGISIDGEAPDINVAGVANGAIYTLGGVPVVSCSANDGVSGVASPCSAVVSGGLASGVGTFTFRATATDNAGNTATASGTYRVVYRWDGFEQPINDTAHQIAQDVSVFKAASTVPVKLKVKRSDGTVVQAGSAPQWLTPVKGGATTAPVDEALYGEQATSGNSYRWDGTGQQHLYKWGTTKSQAGSYWRIGVLLEDGQRYTVNIGLR